MQQGMKLSHSYLKLLVYNTYNFNGSNNCCNVHSWVLKVATGTCVACFLVLSFRVWVAQSQVQIQAHPVARNAFGIPALSKFSYILHQLRTVHVSFWMLNTICSWMTQLVTQPSFLQILPCKNCLVLYLHSKSVSYSWEPSEGNQVNYCNTMQYTVVLRNLGFVENFVPWPVTNVTMHVHNVNLHWLYNFCGKNDKRYPV